MEEPVRYWESSARPRPEWWDDELDRAVLEAGRCSSPQEAVQLFSSDPSLLRSASALWLIEAEARYRRFVPPALSDKLDWPERVLTQNEFENIMHGLCEYGRILGVAYDNIEELFDLVTEWKEEQEDPDDFVEYWKAPAEEMDFEECHPVYKRAVREIGRLKRATPGMFDEFGYPREVTCHTCARSAPVDESGSIQCPECRKDNGTIGKLLIDLESNGPTADPTYGDEAFAAFRSIARDRFGEFSLAAVQALRDWLVANCGLSKEQCDVLRIHRAVQLLQPESPAEESNTIRHSAKNGRPGEWKYLETWFSTKLPEDLHDAKKRDLLIAEYNADATQRGWRIIENRREFRSALANWKRKKGGTKRA